MSHFEIEKMYCNQNEKHWLGSDVDLIEYSANFGDTENFDRY